jgi:hypothetical protein
MASFEGGNGDHSGLHRNWRPARQVHCGSLSFASIRVGDDLGTFTVNWRRC